MRAGPTTKATMRTAERAFADAPPARAVSSRVRSRVEPRLLRRDDAAIYLGVSPSYFDKLCAKGLVPAPKQLGSVKGWDRFELDDAIDTLPRDGATVDEPSDWD